jgi:hypothetical protein
MILPNRIFFTGVPGSRWSGIAQVLEDLPGFNKTDRTPDREYAHSTYSGHKGAYFGRGMEFPADLDLTMIDNAWVSPEEGTQIVKSHDWAYKLDEIHARYRSNNWIMLVYRPDLSSQAWWHEAGGFNIKYPNYSIYKNSTNMLVEIMQQNRAILKFGCDMRVKWEYFDRVWISENFGIDYNIVPEVTVWDDILVAMVRD